MFLKLIQEYRGGAYSGGKGFMTNLTSIHTDTGFSLRITL